MSDIDFDELDKAVNSLMSPGRGGSKPTESRADSQQDEPAVEADLNLEAPTPDELADEPPAMTAEPVEPAPTQPTGRPADGSLATKRRGQFMDMIHPSADMKARQPAASVSRQGVPVQPRRQTVATEPLPDAVLQSASTTVGAEVSTGAKLTAPDSEPDSSLEAAVADDQWPDPIDEPESPDTAEVDSQSAETPGFPDPIDAANSPFLPDAKVEKRPLGPRQADGEASTDDTESTDQLIGEPIEGGDLVGEPEADGPAGSDNDMPAVPEEFQATLMSLESQDLSGPAAGLVDAETTKAPEGGRVGTELEPAEPATTHQSAPPTPLATPSVVEQPPATPASSTSASLSSSLPPRTPAPVTSDEDEAISSIFDTEDSALKHPPKHSSGWYTILVFAGMVLIGVVGAVVYYYTTN